MTSRGELEEQHALLATHLESLVTARMLRKALGVDAPRLQTEVSSHRREEEIFQRVLLSQKKGGVSGGGKQLTPLAPDEDSLQKEMRSLHAKEERLEKASNDLANASTGTTSACVQAIIGRSMLWCDAGG